MNRQTELVDGGVAQPSLCPSRQPFSGTDPPASPGKTAGLASIAPSLDGFPRADIEPLTRHRERQGCRTAT